MVFRQVRRGRVVLWALSSRQVVASSARSASVRR
ncbi:hypothetical protein SFR_3923 [Streptomyces sp. FR-008]|nr:hypothetical protein SFR_3923 [Streptomyces sp. FR-008]